MFELFSLLQQSQSAGMKDEHQDGVRESKTGPLLSARPHPSHVSSTVHI